MFCIVQKVCIGEKQGYGDRGICGTIEEKIYGVEFDNIMSFEEYRQNGYCRDLMKLRTRWDNDKMQDTLINGEKVITTESVLICERLMGRWSKESYAHEELFGEYEAERKCNGFT